LWDENAYLGNSRSHLSESNYTEDFRFPLLEYIILIPWLIFGESILLAKFVMVLGTLGLVFMFYKITDYYFKDGALWMTLIFSLSPLILLWGFRIYPDIPGLFLITTSFYLIIKKKFFFSGVLSGLGFLMKFPYALFPLAVCIVLLYKKNIKELIIFCLGGLVVVCPWMLFNSFKYGNPIWDLYYQYKIVDSFTLKEPVFIQIKNLFFIMMFLLFFIPHGIYYIFKDKKSEYNGIILMYVVLFLTYFLFFVNRKLSRYLIGGLSFMYLISFFGIYYLVKRYSKLKILLFSLVTVSLIITSYLTFFTILSVHECNKGSAMGSTIDFLGENVDSNSIVVSNTWPWFGYHNNLHSRALWSDNITVIIDVYNPEYIIYSPQIGDLYNKLELDSKLNLVQNFTDSCTNEIYVYKSYKNLEPIHINFRNT